MKDLILQGFFMGIGFGVVFVIYQLVLIIFYYFLERIYKKKIQNILKKTEFNNLPIVTSQDYEQNNTDDSKNFRF